MRFLLAFVLLFTCASVGRASVYYNVTVDTSSINGTTGSFDLNFAPGIFTTQNASLQILDFSTDGSLIGSAQTSGDVAGTLPGTLTFDNQTINNDYFENFTYGNSISFEAYLFGPALNAPDGTSTSGSTFAFSMFSDTAGTIPTLTTDTTYGTAVGVNVNLDGSTTTFDNSTQSTIATPTTAAPEPATLLSLSGGALLLGLFHARRQRLHAVKALAVVVQLERAH